MLAGTIPINNASLSSMEIFLARSNKLNVDIDIVSKVQVKPAEKTNVINMPTHVKFF